MSERKDEQWFDDQLRRAVHGDTPRFDAQAWKLKHSEEYRRLTSRSVGWGLPHRVRMGRWLRRGEPHPTAIIRLAVAAAIVVATGLCVLHTNRPQEQISLPELAAGSPAEIMTMRSLSLAYEQGGFDELDRQLQSTLDEFGPRSSGVSSQRLFSTDEWIEESKGIEL
ncbi:MAG: hypothetical protein ABFE01_18970 [Phycisphaerales bacterium]|jgi:hypothetical protein